MLHHASAVLDRDVLEGKGLIAQGAVPQGNGALGGVALVLAEQDIVVEQVGPGVAGRVVVGVRVLCQDVGEGLPILQRDRALIQGVHVLAQLPDLQGSGAIGLVLGRRQQLRQAVVVQVGDGITPIPGLVLLQRGQRVEQRLDLGVGLVLGLHLRRGDGDRGGGDRLGVCRVFVLCRFGRDLAAGGKGQAHDQGQQEAKDLSFFHDDSSGERSPAAADGNMRFFKEQPGAGSCPYRAAHPWFCTRGRAVSLDGGRTQRSSMLLTRFWMVS